MSQFGDVRFATATDAEDARRTLETLMDQKSRSLTRKGIPDIFAPPGHREFYRDLVSNPKTRHLVHVSHVDIGTVYAAANFGIVFADCYYHVLASFVDTEVARYGPGVLHLRELMAHAIKLGLKRFDFTVGDEPYTGMVRYRPKAVRLYGDRDLARLAGAMAFVGTTPDQTSHQADAGTVEPGLARALHHRLAVERASTAI